MKQFKKIELSPLTSSQSLNLQIVENKSFDLSDLDSEVSDKLMDALLKIASRNPNIIVTSGYGDNQSVNTQMAGANNKKKFFTFPEPNPICVCYKSANEHLEKSYIIKKKLNSGERQFDPLNHYDDFVQYFQETSEGIILLSATIEGFINQLLSENLEIEIAGVIKNKEKIEWLDIKTKLRHVLLKITGKDFYKTNKTDYSNLCNIIDLRNDLIHLKKIVKGNQTSYQDLNKRLFDFKHFGCSDSVFIFVNTIIPNFFKEKSMENE